MTWILMRADDNGQAFEMARFDTRHEAEAAALDFESRGHKQVYWVAELDPEKTRSASVRDGGQGS